MIPYKLQRNIKNKKQKKNQTAGIVVQVLQWQLPKYSFKSQEKPINDNTSSFSTQNRILSPDYSTSYR